MPDYSILSIRITAELDTMLAEVAAKIGKSKQETMRLCMELGAKWIEANGYDPTREITQFSAMDSMMEIITAAAKQLDIRDQKLADITAELSKITKKLGTK